MTMILWLSVTSLLASSLTMELHDFELVGGTSKCSGTLWKEQDGKRGRVKDDKFTMKEAHEVCRQLDCGTAVLADVIRVDGKWWDIKVEVICSESVRLVNGTGACSGRVEVKSNQSWVSVCEGDFDQQDAEVVCRQLNCGAPSVLQGALYEEANVPMWTKEFQCGGNESVLLDCKASHSTRNTCSPDKAVGLTCTGVKFVMKRTSKCIGKLYIKPDVEWINVWPNEQIWKLMETHQVCRHLDCGSSVSIGTSDFFGFWFRDGFDTIEVICSDVRLVGGASNCSGTLEKKLDGEWSPVADKYIEFQLRTAHEVCRQLDCGTAVSTQTTKGLPDSEAHKRHVEVTCSESVRLVNGSSWCSGRVEVKSNQSWVSVCEGDFDQQDAEVVCRQLGCGLPLVLQGALYGEGNVPMWTKEFQCKGNESVLLDCRTSTRNTCSPDKAVGLTCSDYKLVEAERNCLGKLRERHDGGWRSVDRAHQWKLMKENKLCRQLDCGYAASGILLFIDYGKVELVCLDIRLVGGTSDCNGILEKKEDGEWVQLQDYGHTIDLRAAHEVCRLLQCGIAVSTQTTDGRWSWNPKTTKVICSDSVRLVNGPSEFSGRVEVKSNQSWVSVCEDDFDQQEAEVVCRQLGGGTNPILRGALYGSANVPMWTKEFQCVGNESVLLDCRTNLTRNTCSPDKAVGLTCSEFRLVGGTSNCAGVLEMQLWKEWRPTLDRYRDWDIKASHVVCRQLGCGHALGTGRRSGSKRQAVWHTISTCKGSESSAKDCISKEWSHSSETKLLREITCSGPPVQPTLSTRA